MAKEKKTRPTRPPQWPASDVMELIIDIRLDGLGEVRLVPSAAGAILLVNGTPIGKPVATDPDIDDETGKTVGIDFYPDRATLAALVGKLAGILAEGREV